MHKSIIALGIESSCDDTSIGIIRIDLNDELFTGEGLKSEQIREAVAGSLYNWFKKEDWVRINTSGNIAGPCGTMKKGKPTTRCLPRKKAQSLTKAERKASAQKKKREGKKGKQFVKNPK